MLTNGALFPGIGGIELGIERTQYFRTKWFAEVDEFCISVLRRHWPDVPNYGDVTKIDWSAMPKVDMLTGGFPCQDISIANPHGKGIEGSRSGLWKEYAKAIRILRPKYALVENVPAIVRKGLDVVLADLAEAGYDAEWLDLRASDFGALHKRERIFIIAYPNAERTLDREVREFANQGRQHALGDASKGVEAEADTTHLGYGKHDAGGDVGQRGGVGEVPRSQDTECLVVADDLSERIERFWQKKVQGGEGFSWCKDVRRVEDLQGRPDIPQPLFRGGRDGIPDWVDRIKALGNAVVPDCAEFIGEMIMEFNKKQFPKRLWGADSCR